jgi:hypothetical protein
MIWIVRSLGCFSLGLDLPAESGASKNLLQAILGTITGHDNLRRTEWDGIVPKMATFEKLQNNKNSELGHQSMQFQQASLMPMQ